MKYAIGIDIGSSSAKMVLASPRMRVVRRAAVPCDPTLPWRDLLDAIAAAAVDLAGGREIAGVGVGCAGCVDREKGVVHLVPNLPRWKKVPVRDFIGGRLGARCVLDNDVNMMALGEFRHGAGRGARNLFCLTVGTGVGGGIVINSEIYRGGTKSAGEIGHIPVEPEGIPCPCGSRGCLERYIGTEGLVCLARAAMRGRRSLLKGLADLSPPAIEAAARRGDPAARSVWERAGYYLGLGMVVVVNMFNPDRIVVGGGISGAGDLLLGPARKVVRERALPIPAARLRIVPSALGADGGCIGAASEALRIKGP